MEFDKKKEAGEDPGFFDDQMAIDSLYEYNETFKEIFEQEKTVKDSEDDKTPKASTNQLA